MFAVMAMHKFGRLPVLFWSQLLALVFMILATFSQTLGVFAGESSCRRSPGKHANGRPSVSIPKRVLRV